MYVLSLRSADPFLSRLLFQEKFKLSIKHILRPVDGDIATSLGAAQCGVAQSIMRRPLVADTIVAPKSYIVGIGPAQDQGQRLVLGPTSPDVIC